MEAGPNCLYVKRKNEYEIKRELKKIYPNDNSIINGSPEYIYSKLSISSFCFNKAIRLFSTLSKTSKIFWIKLFISGIVKNNFVYCTISLIASQKIDIRIKSVSSKS